jgi:hypothetical protein
MCAPKDVVVDNGSEWRLTGIYGEQRWETDVASYRALAWERCSSLDGDWQGTLMKS